MNAYTITIGVIHGKKFVFMVYIKVKLNVQHTVIYERGRIKLENNSSNNL